MVLNKKQRLFIDKYMTNGKNATRAYMQVYSPKNDNVAAVQASKLLREPKVKEEIARREKEEIEKYNVKREDQMKILFAIRDCKIADYYVYDIDTMTIYDKDGEAHTKEIINKRMKLPNELTEDQMLAIKEIKETKSGNQEIVLYDKQFAIQELNRMCGFLEQTIKVDNKLNTSDLKNLDFDDLLKLVNECEKKEEENKEEKKSK